MYGPIVDREGPLPHWYSIFETCDYCRNLDLRTEARFVQQDDDEEAQFMCPDHFDLYGNKLRHFVRTSGEEV